MSLPPQCLYRFHSAPFPKCATSAERGAVQLRDASIIEGLVSFNGKFGSRGCGLPCAHGVDETVSQLAKVRRVDPVLSDSSHDDDITTCAHLVGADVQQLCHHLRLVRFERKLDEGPETGSDAATMRRVWLSTSQ